MRDPFDGSGRFQDCRHALTQLPAMSADGISATVKKLDPLIGPAALLRGADSMFDYRLSILVGQKTNSHLLGQNLFPALRARKARRVRAPGRYRYPSEL